MSITAKMKKALKKMKLDDLVKTIEKLNSVFGYDAEESLNIQDDKKKPLPKIDLVNQLLEEVEDIEGDDKDDFEDDEWKILCIVAGEASTVPGWATENGNGNGGEEKDKKEDEDPPADKKTKKSEKKKEKAKKAKGKSKASPKTSNLDVMKGLLVNKASDKEIITEFTERYKNKEVDADFIAKRIAVYKNLAEKEL